MKILLDTHYLIWCLNDSSMLTKREQQIIIDSDSEIFISSISLWELSLKYSLGKIKFKNISINDIIEGSKSSGYQIINMDENEAIGFHRIPKTGHKDPFDRMLINQAICKNFHFMTRDDQIEQYEKIGLKVVKLR